MDKTLDDANIQTDRDVSMEVHSNGSSSAFGGCMSSVQEKGSVDKETMFVLVESSNSSLSIARGLSASKGVSRSCSLELSQSQNLTSLVKDLDSTCGVSGRANPSIEERRCKIFNPNAASPTQPYFIFVLEVSD